MRSAYFSLTSSSTRAKVGSATVKRDVPFSTSLPETTMASVISRTVPSKGGDVLTRELSMAVESREPGSQEVQAITARHHAWKEHFYPADAERYTGLAEMDVADQRFTEFYDRFAPGLAVFLAEGMKVFARTQLR